MAQSDSSRIELPVIYPAVQDSLVEDSASMGLCSTVQTWTMYRIGLCYGLSRQMHLCHKPQRAQYQSRRFGLVIKKVIKKSLQIRYWAKYVGTRESKGWY